MATEEAVASTRPRPWLLILLGLAAVALIASWMWPSASASPGSRLRLTRRDLRLGAARQRWIPSDLDVKLESLQAAAPGGRAGRAESVPVPAEAAAARAAGASAGADAAGQHRAAATAARTAAAAADSAQVHRDRGEAGVQGRGDERLPRHLLRQRRGESSTGATGLVRIGVESLVIEYVDGRGRTTVRLEGCPPR